MPKPNSRSRSILILGLGRAGRSLALTFRLQGWSVDVWDRDGRKARAFARKNRCRAVADWKAPVRLVLIAVPDGAVGALAASLLARGPLPSTVLHMSGVLSLEPLRPLRRAGWRIGKWHPMYAFPFLAQALPRGVTFGVRGEPADAARSLERLSRRFGGATIDVLPGADAGYHLACVAAANFLFAQACFARSLLTKAARFKRGSTPESALIPLLQSSLENLRRNGLREGLTGPWARGDRATLEAHAAFLKRKAPDLLPFYREAGRLLERLLSPRPSARRPRGRARP
jgi:predicted short-subunit dehydrogenase-like oxidoreductase (DUF2520 family)